MQKESVSRAGLGLLLALFALAGSATAADPSRPVVDEPRGNVPPTEVVPYEPVGPTLTVGECIRRALANGFDLELQRHDLAIAQDNVPIARSEFMPVLSADANRGASRTSITDPNPDLHSNTINSEVGIEEKFLTGTTLGLTTTLERFASNQPLVSLTGGTLTEINSNLTYTAGVALKLTQPLLKGLGSVNTIALRQAQIGSLIAEHTLEDRALDVIQSTEVAYYQLSGTREQVGVFQASSRLAEALLKEADGRHRAGMATKLDLLQAQVGVERAKLNVLQAEKVTRAAEDTLLAQIGRFELDEPVGPVAVEDLVASPAPSPAASYAVALRHQPAIENARARMELSRLDLALAKDGLKPQLDLALSFNLGGIAPSSRAAFSAVVEPQESSWEADLNLTYPIGMVGERARVRQANHALERDDLAIHQLEQNVLVSVRDAVRNVNTSKESVKIAALAASLAQEQYEAETIRFKSGLSTSRRVLEAQSDLESARVAALQSKLDLRVAYAALYRIEGSSLDRYGITLIKQQRDRN